MQIYRVATTLFEAHDTDTKRYPRLKALLEYMYPGHELSRREDRLTIDIPLKDWRQMDRDFFEKVYDERLINYWRLS